MAAEEHGFKAEVQQLLDLMIHAVYSNRDVFLRELISNAADALDKVRFLELTDELQPSVNNPPGIRFTIDEDAKTIVLSDDGVGMTHEEAVENLGTIAHSGSKAFFQKVKEEGADNLPELIGQFGVGFYSCFMVARRVVVETRSARLDAEAVRWISEGAGAYTVEAGDRLERGTTITLELREDAEEYATEAKIREIVRQHSNFVSWPIFLGDDQINSGKALWREEPSQVSDEDAAEFYRSLAMDWQDPELRIHLKVDSPLQYSAMLFVPSNKPYDLFQPDADRGPRLYARRVLILDHAKELLPEWMRFIRGVVDSEDISLNVSREMIQKTPVVRKIRDALTKRVLKELGKLAKRELEPVEAAEPEEGEEAVTPEPQEHPYARFWKNFSVLMKEGYFHDKSSYGDRLLPLLRFNTLNHADGEGLMSLAEYRESMPEDQDTLWFITAENREAALASPHLEAFRQRGWNVLLLTDTVDEWLTQALTEYDELPVKSVTRGELELQEDEDDADKADISGLAPWMTELFAGDIAAVRPSTRLTDSPAVLVDGEHGPSANMERILRSANQEVGPNRRTLELNVKHPLIQSLAQLHESGRSGDAAPIARLLLDDALLMEGTVTDAPAIGRRLQALLVSAAQQAVAAEPNLGA